MLYVVATPIGNMGDITLRALETLKAADYVVSEDTRKTGMFLKHFDIKKPQISFHEYNEDRQVARIMDLLNEGKHIALVSDAGMPGISDPGYLLVRAAIEGGIPLTVLPGPTAVIMAAVLSGLPVHSFTFRGFPPRKTTGRRRFLQVDEHSPHTLVFYESPYRLKVFLEDALFVYGDRQAAVANDLTKMFETVLRGSLSELIQQVTATEPRGEYCVVISGLRDARRSAPEDEEA
ncbi:MAG: 16S rRNA (cytidine(1402)-2'-O)-methyltransferase [Anaerolineaceae bacterium]